MLPISGLQVENKILSIFLLIFFSFSLSLSLKKKIRKLSFGVFRAIDKLRFINQLGWKKKRKVNLYISDLVDQAASEVVNIARQNAHFSFSNLMTISLNETFESIGTHISKSDEQQTFWTICFAYFLVVLKQIYPEIIKPTLDVLYPRLKCITVEDLNKSTETLIWWRNYVLFCCSTISGSFSSNF